MGRIPVGSARVTTSGLRLTNFMKHIFTISLCFLALSLSAQEDCLLINEEINDFVVMGTFDSHQYYISENPVPISDGFYEVYNDLASLYSGNLLTIGSMEEDEYIYSTFFNGGFSNLSSYYYIGLYNTDPSNLCCGQGNPPGVWEWINGESVEYTNWDINANQPSGDELYASGGGSWGGVWADVSGGHQGYIIIEVEQCPVSVSGCLDSLACNFNEYATEEDGSCDYTCCPGPGCCNIGMTWNWELGICETSIPTDSNLDGCTDLNDLMDLLAAYGDCAVSEFTCGDPLEYQGYDYETVLIGEQCWFAENLRAENYRNGDAIPADLSDSEWAGTVEGAVSFYDGDMVKLSAYGRLYNRYAVDDTRALCPSNWHVSTDDDWVALELEMTNQGYAGIEGRVLKATEGWIDSGNGPDTYGFSAQPAGARNFQDGTFYNDGIGGDWWTSSTYHRYLLYNFDTLGQGLTNQNFGFSVRCIKD